MTAIEKTRLLLSKSTDAGKKSKLGQFLTPESIAKFMAGMFPDSTQKCRLLDAGAGIGSLSSAFLARWKAGDLNFESVEVDAYEIDPELRRYLTGILAECDKARFAANFHRTDFILAATEALARGHAERQINLYTHAILNPPYKKISSTSDHRKALRTVGIETVNLYSAFVALAVALSHAGGQIVAIIPRSFCNGPYYRPFREFILGHAAIRHIHLFNSRKEAFRDDDVLQENIIIRLERGAERGDVIITTSTDQDFSDIESRIVPFSRIVEPGDSELFIHVPTSGATADAGLKSAFNSSLEQVGIKVSTGPVVDFRVREHLRDFPGPNTAPLLYPIHFKGGSIQWPSLAGRKPNAIVRNSETEKSMYPSGFYCVVRRFSSKEERRRIVASVVEPDRLDGSAVVGFENHLNVFHENRKGLPETVARGLAVYLNSTSVDETFRRFSGHTQVNATDLRRMKFPDRETLSELGAWAIENPRFTQEMIDKMLRGKTT